MYDGRLLFRIIECTGQDITVNSMKQPSVMVVVIRLAMLNNQVERELFADFLLVKSLMRSVERIGAKPEEDTYSGYDVNWSRGSKNKPEPPKRPALSKIPSVDWICYLYLVQWLII